MRRTKEQVKNETKPGFFNVYKEMEWYREDKASSSKLSSHPEPKGVKKKPKNWRLR